MNQQEFENNLLLKLKSVIGSEEIYNLDKEKILSVFLAYFFDEFLKEFKKILK